MFGLQLTSSCYSRHNLPACLLATLVCATAAQAEEPLHRRIDQAIHAGIDAATVEVCSDAEFIRRIYLDLVGMIPTADETRAFLDDGTADKRTQLVDRLLADPRYARHMATSFDVMLMERRGDKHVKTPQWQQYLYTSFVENKPYDQLAREILGADGVDDKSRSAARFYLDREGETHLLTRDVGRTFFGKDMQCAQCHDHPLIDDYLQRDYYGIFAFLNRSYLFADKKAKKSVFAEKAEGDAKFQSVFDETSKGVMRPKLPGDAELAEPVFKKGEEYAVKPAKGVRAVPKYSRRQLLAQHATTGKNQAFNRNIANRLWALMMGRGLVEPVDLHHADNPPTHPELMQVLADQLMAMKFDIKVFLRELALSKTYQRPLELPSGVAAQATAAAQRSAELVASEKLLAVAIEQHKTTLEKLAADVKTSQDAVAPIQAEMTKAGKPLAVAQKAVTDAQKLLNEAQKKLAAKLAAKQDVGNLLDEASKKIDNATKGPAAKKPAAKPTVIKDVPAGSETLADDEASIKKAIEQRTATVKVAREKLAVEQKVIDEIQARLAPIQKQLMARKTAREEAQTRLRSDQSAAKQVERKLEEIEVLVNYGKTLAAGGASPVAKLDSAAGTEAQDKLTQLWTEKFLVAALKTLSPEQLSWSMMQASGMVARQQTAAQAKVNAPPKAASKKDGKKTDPKSTPPKKAQPLTPPQRILAIEQQVYAGLKGNLTQYIQLFSAGAGQPQYDFFATVDQALFFANGDRLPKMFAPAGGNFTERAAKATDPQTVAEEIYLSLLTRKPTAEEVADVAQYLAPREKDRAVALQEIVWGLVTSAEFRFNH